MTYTVAEAFGGPDAAYFGNRPHDLILASTHRDSDALARANFQAAATMAADRGIETIEVTYSHWLVGYGTHLTVAPDAAGRELAAEIVRKLEDYPALDDELFSDLEYADVMETLEDFAQSTYPDLDASRLAPRLYDALTSRSGDSTPYLERWPRLERDQSAVYDERALVADALRAYRNEMRSAA